MPPEATMPSAPALEHAAANAPVAILAIPPCIRGNSVPKSSLSFMSVLSMPRAGTDSLRTLQQRAGPGKARTKSNTQRSPTRHERARATKFVK